MFIDGSKFREQFVLKKGHSCEIISKLDKRFWQRRFFNNFFMAVYCKKPPFTRAMFMNRPEIRERFVKRVSQGTFLWICLKIGPAVSEKKIFEEFLHVRIVHEVPIPQSHVYGQVKISRTIFWKGSPKEHSCEIISRSDKRFKRKRFLKNCFKNFISIRWQPEFLMESNSVNNF